MYCPNCGNILEGIANFCSNCGQEMMKTADDQEVKAVVLDFRNILGYYPYLDIEDSNKNERQRWNPPECNKDRLKEIVLEEINQWLTKGWKLVENDPGKLFLLKKTKIEKTEVLKSVLLFHPSRKYITRWTFKGAKFHVTH